MKIIILSIFTGLFLSSCGNDINPKPLQHIDSSIETTNFFALAAHTTMGSCSNPPLAHRMIRFVPIFLSEVTDDIFIGDLTLALFQETNSYEALYREWPGAGNADQSLFELKIQGMYHYESSEGVSGKTILKLDNIGSLVPSANNDKVSFILNLNKYVNRPFAQAQVQGRVHFGSSSLFEDCL